MEPIIESGVFIIQCVGISCHCLSHFTCFQNYATIRIAFEAYPEGPEFLAEERLCWLTFKLFSFLNHLDGFLRTCL